MSGFEATTLDHVQLTVPRAAEQAALAFYRDVLALTEIAKPAPLRARGGGWFRLGELQLHVGVEDLPAESAPSRRHLCLRVGDLDAAVHTLRAAGLIVVDDERPIPGCRRAYVRDPGGNLLEVAQFSADSS